MAMLAIQVTGCLGPYCNFNSPVFSPDSSKVAYAYEEGFGWGLCWLTPWRQDRQYDGLRGALYDAVKIHWRSTTESAAPTDSIWVDAGGLPPLNDRLFHGTCVWSPDSRNLMVHVRDRIVIIDTQSRKQWHHELHGAVVPGDVWCNTSCELHGAAVPPFFWIGPDEIGYVAYDNLRNQSEDNGVGDRTFWRWNIHGPADARTAVFSEKNVRVNHEDFTGQREWVSPQGRYVLYIGGEDDIGGEDESHFCLLDMTTGTVRHLMRCHRTDNVVAWKHDESAFFCAAKSSSPPQTWIRAAIVDARTGSALDVLYHFRAAFGPLWDDIEWTAEGEYLTINGNLVRPRPWEVIPVAQRVADQLGIAKSDSGSRAMVRPLPIPKRLLVWATDSNFYVVDYEGRILAPMGRSIDYWYSFFSPDCSKVAGIEWKGHFRINDFNPAIGP